MSINTLIFRVLPRNPVLGSWKHLGGSQLGCLTNVLNSNSNAYATSFTVTSRPAPAGEKQQTKTVSKVMQAYLERAKEHDEFMKVKDEEFRIGKRHLANMMGEDPETFTQQDIDNAIAYLFPSGLYDSRARPFMKPPEEVFPQRKAAEFDESGRPHHSMFYTGKPNYYQLLYEIVEHINQSNSFEDRMIRQQKTVDPALQLSMSGAQWVSKDDLENILVETIGDLDYQNFITAMERLCSLPYSYRLKDFIMKYRKPLLARTNVYEIAKPKYDTDGRMYVTTYECLRKSARGDVTVRSPGSGKISINGKDILYFRDIQPREQLLFPLLFARMNDKVDVEANVEGGGPSGQAGAVRWGIAMCLRSFVDAETVERMRLAGLLQRDYRRRERKKPGQAKARKKFTWQKR
ncbi:28S ribosomal protein S9, mitochondrial [Bradysia coprophila]|uniref:28S ribosomal protein S9, mitochondrial n=1 Tax=Bradysia coprophila TaxID=38358 RepID=UPI00187DA4AC|nr:28S ribosomal protein S9, mitochondrial [Bradysia coprophila]